MPADAGGRGWPARSRTSSASSSARGRRSAWATCRRLDDEPAVVAAVDRAGADDVVDALPAGLRHAARPTWPDGVDVSFGQWQKLALARGFMRDEPLLLVLDEPTAALDAETEHALFERYAAGRRDGASDDGRITILVSHRFSHRADGRPDRRARRLPGRRGRQPRGADGARRPVRRAVRDPGARLPVKAIFRWLAQQQARSLNSGGNGRVCADAAIVKQCVTERLNSQLAVRCGSDGVNVRVILSDLVHVRPSALGVLAVKVRPQVGQ